MRYAIPDTHGCPVTLGVMIDERIKLQKSDTLYLLGDYCDRGPDSKGVYDRIIRMREAGYDIQAIRGNHDDWMVTFAEEIKNQSYWASWIMNGGDTTLKSFQTDDPRKIDKKYIELVKAMPTYIELDDYVLVHGGLNMYLEDPVKGTAPDDMMWERPYGEESRKDKWPLGKKKLVVGHTVRTTDQIRGYVDSGNCIMLDNGCVFKHQNNKGFGNLVCFNLDTKELVFQTNLDVY